MVTSKPNSPKGENPVQAIKAARANSNQALARQDAQGACGMMAADIVITVGSGETISGRDDVYASLWAQFEASPDCLYIRSPKSVKVAASGDLAFEDGIWTGSWTADGKAVSCGGRYAAAWKRENTGKPEKARWLIRSEIFVTLYER